MIAGIPWWIELPVALLLALSGVFTLTAAVGLVLPELNGKWEAHIPETNYSQLCFSEIHCRPQIL